MVVAVWMGIMGSLRDLTGQKFSTLQVVSRVGSNKFGKATWLCQCDCGLTKVISSDHLTRKIDPVKSCGCLQIKQGSDHHQWTGYGEITGAWWATHVSRSAQKNRPSRQNIPITITIKEAWELFLSQDRKCALSGVPITFNKGNVTASLDRIDSTKGYEVGNVWWVHKDINLMKNVFSVDKFISLCQAVVRASNPWGQSLSWHYEPKEPLFWSDPPTSYFHPKAEPVPAVV